jgi:glutaconate CoA-transferase subunit A
MSKVYSLSEAVSKFVHHGDHIAFSGFTTNRKPYAAVYEIIRQGQGGFIAEAGPAGGDWDMLIGAGRVKAFINCYTANSGFSNVSRRFRNAIEKGKMLFEDYSQDAVVLMFTGAALGLPYVPVRVMLGSDLVNKWGISEEERRKIGKLPPKKFVIQEDPFHPGQQLVLLPTPRLDTAIIHVQKASPDGTCRIEGDEFHDVDIAIASKHCIVTCEELISNEEIRGDPNLNSIPGFVVDAVVHAPHGAHPAQCYNYYDYDAKFLSDYDKVSASDEDFKKFLDQWAYGVKSHEEYLDKLGASRLIKTKVVPGLGYAPKSKGKV